MNELEIHPEQIFTMVTATVRQTIKLTEPIEIVASDSYGEHKHRTWVFVSLNKEIVGTIERYWGGLKMICSVLGGSPRTSFFTEDGIRTTNKGLKGL